MQKYLFIILLAMFYCTAAHGAAADHEQIVAGAGPSTEIARIFFKKFSSLPVAAGYRFKIPAASTKHAGGISSSDLYLFGRTGRPLTDMEKSLNKGEIILAQVPISFAAGQAAGIGRLTIDRLRDIYLGKIVNWQEVGGPDAPIDVVGREKTEALYSVLVEKYHFFSKAKFTTIFKKDHEVLRYLSTSRGRNAIAFGAKPNFAGLDNVTVLQVDGLSAGVKLGLVYDLANREHPVVKATMEYAASSDWAAIVSAADYLPPAAR